MQWFLKKEISSLEEAFLLLFIHSLYESEEWSMDNSMWKEGFNSQEWKELLKKTGFPNI